MKEYLADLHTHTVASGHAYSTISEMITAAQKAGLKMLGITEHAKNMPGTCDEIYFINFRVIDRKIGDLELLMGVELNILDYDGNVDMDKSLLGQMDVVIASMHMPCIKPGTIEENTNAYIKCCENKYINIIGHPDDGRYLIDYKRLVEAAARTNTLLEVNNSSLSPDSFRKNAKENYTQMLSYCKELGVPVIINSDAHYYTKVGGHSYALELIDEIDFPLELVMNFNTDKLKTYLRAYKNKC